MSARRFTGTPRAPTARHSARVAVREGKFHQVKRMFLGVGKQVLLPETHKIGLLELTPPFAPANAAFLQDSELETVFLPDPLAEPRQP